jgi:HSP20 family protein
MIAMANVSLWSPFSEFVSLRDAMDRLVSDSFINPRSTAYGMFGNMSMPASLYETPDTYIVQVFLPGLNPDAIDVQTKGSVLYIKGDHQPPQFEGATQIWSGIPYGHFEQSFTLPAAVAGEEAQASYEWGVLTLTLPKVAHARTQSIKVEQGKHLEWAQKQPEQLATAGAK